MKRFLFIPLMFFLFTVTGYASQSPVNILENTTDQLLSALKQNRNTIQDNPRKVGVYVKRIVLPIVDINNMAKFAMGRQGWGEATPSQRETFKGEFIDLVIGTYSAALASYKDQKVLYEPLREGYTDKKRVKIDSEILQSDGRKIPVSYRMVNTGSTWRVYDFSVEGISMIQSFRSQFANYLNQKGGVDALLIALKKHNAKE